MKSENAELRKRLDRQHLVDLQRLNGIGLYFETFSRTSSLILLGFSEGEALLSGNSLTLTSEGKGSNA